MKLCFLSWIGFWLNNLEWIREIYLVIVLNFLICDWNRWIWIELDFGSTDHWQSSFSFGFFIFWFISVIGAWWGFWFQATRIYCFVHKVPVCGECICFPEHQICVVTILYFASLKFCYLQFWNHHIVNANYSSFYCAVLWFFLAWNSLWTLPLPVNWVIIMLMLNIWLFWRVMLIWSAQCHNVISTLYWFDMVILDAAFEVRKIMEGIFIDMLIL